MWRAFDSRRYSIPLILATGTRHQRDTLTDDAGMSHKLPNAVFGTPQYPIEDVIYGNKFGTGTSLT